MARRFAIASNEGADESFAEAAGAWSAETENKLAMSPDEQHEQFVQLLVSEQLALKRYLLTILGDADAAATALQEANLVLLRKWEEFAFETSFTAWARRVAYYQALSMIRDSRRSRLLFSEQLVEQLAERVDDEGDITETLLALRHCLAELGQPSIDLVQQRYGADLPIKVLAEKLGQTQSALKVRLHRIRKALLACIQRQKASR